MNWKKNNFIKLINFILLIIFGVFFHSFVWLFGSVIYFTYFSAFIFLVFSTLFILDIKINKIFLFFVLFILFIQVLIYFIPFSKCRSFLKQPMPTYNCKCFGFIKTRIAGNQCIGRLKKCYKYGKLNSLGNEKLLKLFRENPYHSEFEISCKGFPPDLN